MPFPLDLGAAAALEGVGGEQRFRVLEGGAELVERLIVELAHHVEDEGRRHQQREREQFAQPLLLRPLPRLPISC